MWTLQKLHQIRSWNFWVQVCYCMVIPFPLGCAEQWGEGCAGQYEHLELPGLWCCSQEQSHSPWAVAEMEAESQMHLTDIFLSCFSTQLNSRQWWSFARSIGSILCKTHFFAFWSIFLPMPNLYFALLFYFYIIAKNSLPGSWRASLSQVVAAYLHCSCCISHAFPEAAFFFFLIKQKTCIYFFVIIEAI